MPAEQLKEFVGFLIAPGSPYRSMQGALRVIRFARETGIPLLGTCGGFQHVVVEYVRNVLGVTDAEHEETAPTAAHLAVTALSCSLVGQQHTVSFLPGSHVAAIYDGLEAVEPFFCNFGLNPDYRVPLEEAGLRGTGLDQQGEARVLELADHPFYLATLYVPQTRSTVEAPHPLIAAFVAAARRAASTVPLFG
jgi:CTP synthase (UTP-ammonia lyase)